MSSSSSSSSSTSSLDDLFFPMPELEGNELDDQINTIMEEYIIEMSQEARGSSSRPRRRRCYIDRDRESGHVRLFNDYFADNPTYNEALFRRRFRMRRHVFLRITNSLSNAFEYFRQRPDATGRLGLSPLQKCTAAMRMLAYGVSADAVDDYVRIAAGTARQCLSNFVDGIITLFEAEYLRKPTASDMQRLLYVGEQRGWPGMVGSIDCMHWEWKNCPIAWQGQYASGHKKKPTIVLEAVASYDLWIWHAFFGTPGTCNDINVLDRSPVFDDVLHGRAPEAKFVVNGHEYKMAYYLADGIYPNWAAFVSTIRQPFGAKDSLFAQHQESTRKDVERAFGVLQARFAIIRHPARSWDLSLIGKIMKACIILHNMIVEDERDTYQWQYDTSEFDQVEDVQTSSSTLPAEMRDYIENRVELRDSETHHQLKADLVEHIWERFGTDEDDN